MGMARACSRGARPHARATQPPPVARESRHYRKGASSGSAGVRRARNAPRQQAPTKAKGVEMKKMGWGFGLAAAVVLMAGQALAQSGGSGGSTSGSTDTSRDSSQGTMGGSSGSSTGSSSSMGTGSSATGDTTGTSRSGSTDTSGTSASSTPSSNDTSSASGRHNAIQGKVKKFDKSKNQLTLSGNDKPLKVDSTTKVTKDGSRASLDDIKEGDQVRASYSGSGDTLMVSTIDIMPAGSMGTGSS